MVRELTPKQQRWIAAYIGPARWNATEAAHMAGYAGDRRTLAVTGHRNRYAPLVAAGIAALCARWHVEEEFLRLCRSRPNRVRRRWETNV